MEETANTVPEAQPEGQGFAAAEDVATTPEKVPEAVVEGAFTTMAEVPDESVEVPSTPEVVAQQDADAEAAATAVEENVAGGGEES